MNRLPESVGHIGALNKKVPYLEEPYLEEPHNTSPLSQKIRFDGGSKRAKEWFRWRETSTNWLMPLSTAN